MSELTTMKPHQDPPGSPARARRAIAQWTDRGLAATWTPTTLHAIGRDEQYLENVLSISAELLGLESRQTGIAGPFRVFRQLRLPTPTGRTIFPDMTILTASGHVLVVEVKRSINPELRDRAVIAQIVDYAASFAALSDSQILELFLGQSSALEFSSYGLCLFSAGGQREFSTLSPPDRLTLLT